MDKEKAERASKLYKELEDLMEDMEQEFGIYETHTLDQALSQLWCYAEILEVNNGK